MNCFLFSKEAVSYYDKQRHGQTKVYNDFRLPDYVPLQIITISCLYIRALWSNAVNFCGLLSFQYNIYTCNNLLYDFQIYLRTFFKEQTFYVFLALLCWKYVYFNLLCLNPKIIKIKRQNNIFLLHLSDLNGIPYSTN